MHKFNILQVMPEFGLAGAERMCETLCYELQNSGYYNVFVVSLFDFHSPITERMESKGIKVFYVGKRAGFDIKIIYKLAKLMRVLHIDILHTHRYVMQYAIPAAILSGVKVRVHTIHNIAEKEVDSLRQKMACFFYRFCNVIPVSISPQVQKSVMMRYELNANQSPIVYNGSDLSRCLIKGDYKAHKPFRFVHIGRFNPQKNHRVIIDATSLLKAEGYKVSITLIGGAGNEEELREEVKQKGLKDDLVFEGLQNNVYPFLHKSDCFILPSLYEGMPVTLIEAMGCGMPIIASEVGGVPDMIKNGVSGLLIDPTAVALARAMKKIMEDDMLRQAIGRRALRDSKKFSSRQMFLGYDTIYRNKLSKIV